MCVCVCVCACVHACVRRVCVSEETVCVCLCVLLYLYTAVFRFHGSANRKFAIYILYVAVHVECMLSVC